MNIALSFRIKQVKEIKGRNILVYLFHYLPKLNPIKQFPKSSDGQN